MKNNFNIINNKSGFTGNYYDKYNTKNIIEKYIINNYYNTILKICKNYSINSFIDVIVVRENGYMSFQKKVLTVLEQIIVLK